MKWMRLTRLDDYRVVTGGFLSLLLVIMVSSWGLAEFVHSKQQQKHGELLARTLVASISAADLSAGGEQILASVASLAEIDSIAIYQDGQLIHFSGIQPPQTLPENVARLPSDHQDTGIFLQPMGAHRPGQVVRVGLHTAFTEPGHTYYHYLAWLLALAALGTGFYRYVGRRLPRYPAKVSPAGEAPPSGHGFMDRVGVGRLRSYMNIWRRSKEDGQQFVLTVNLFDLSMLEPHVRPMFSRDIRKVLAMIAEKYSGTLLPDDRIQVGHAGVFSMQDDPVGVCWILRRLVNETVLGTDDPDYRIGLYGLKAGETLDCGLRRALALAAAAGKQGIGVARNDQNWFQFSTYGLRRLDRVPGVSGYLVAGIVDFEYESNLDRIYEMLTRKDFGR